MAHKIRFHNRGHEVTRLEAFSDVVFGFCISLLVISLEAPKSYTQMMEMLRGFLPFTICFFLFIDIWFEHHDFFRRYALYDFKTVTLNTFLLFVMLAYIYPLKFMFTIVSEALTGGWPRLPPGGYRMLFTIYSGGFALVFLLLAAMYAHAYRLRDELALNEVEKIDTRESIYDNLCTGMFGVLSVALAHTPWTWLAGMIYFFLGVSKWVVPWVMRAKRARTEAALLAAA